MAKKHISKLVPDILNVVKQGKVPSEEHLELFLSGLKQTLTEVMTEGCKERKPTLRMSNIGQPDRKLWYTLKGYKAAPIGPQQSISFWFGHIIEQFMLLLARHANHEVSEEQKTLELDGVIGHKDARIDGVTIDVKGLSPYNFSKIKSGRLLIDDPYGYMDQISCYAQAEDDDLAGFVGFNKATGEIATLLLDETELRDAKGRIAHVREFLSKDEPPARCYPDEEHGEAGNRILGKNCSYCPFKETCWQNLRAFQYSDGLKYFTEVVKEPRVEEIKLNETILEEAKEE